METLISIIIPAYNSEKFIGQTLRTTLGQTYAHLEVIVVDDGSQDATAEIVRDFQRQDTRVIFIRQQNQGSAAARNAGIAQARGAYYAFIDADDEMLPSRIEEQLAFLVSNPQVSAVSCLAHYTNEKGQVIGKTYSDLYTIEDCKRYVQNNEIIFCLQPGVMLRPEAFHAVGGYREDILYAQDIDLWNRMAEAGYYLVVMPKVLINYRIHQEASMTRLRVRMDYADWVLDNIRRRRSGQQEFSFQEFIQELSDKPLIYKVKRWQNHMGKYLYRMAGLMFGGKNYLWFAIYLLLAFLLKPAYTLNKIRRQKLS